MYEFVFVLGFSVAGAIAALLALRAASASPAVRWMSALFLIALAANLGLHAWPAVAADPAGAARLAGIAAMLALAAWGYARLLRAARRAAGQRRDGQ